MNMSNIYKDPATTALGLVAGAAIYGTADLPQSPEDWVRLIAALLAAIIGALINVFGKRV